MRFRRTCVESLGYCVPEEVVTSEQVEQRLGPLYDRLRLPSGRLELMTGIHARRVWPAAMLPSDKSIESGQLAIEASGIDRREIGALVHASVCRDHLEPATACRVHHALGLAPDCVIYDVSNACLGILSGMLQVANMIELQQIRAGLIVGTEDSRPLLETTIARLNRDTSFTRQSLKPVVASLTIGSGSCAIVMTDESISETQNHLRAAAVRTHSAHHQLCHSGRDEAAAGGMAPWMETDSELLMHEGIATGLATFSRFLEDSQWTRPDLDRIICHQVGGTHRKMMLDALGLDLERDFATFPWLGNTGSVALPLSLAVGCQTGWLPPGDQRVALLGIGSGINCLMLGVDWRMSHVRGELPVDVERLYAKEV